MALSRILHCEALLSLWLEIHSLLQLFLNAVSSLIQHSEQTMSSLEADSAEIRLGSVALPGTKLYIDPNADAADLFKSFNRDFFWDQLKYVEVRWSPRMTSCAGVCAFDPKPGYCSIRLSRPLMALRGKLDLVETLLHEMIHAYLFVTENDRDRDDHGPEFLKHMHRINGKAGLNISVYHTFHEEVKFYQQHIWQCNGPCQYLSPFFGKVHRAMNRAPGPLDLWWSDHQETCSGTFSKISEPVGYKAQKTNRKLCRKAPEMPNNKDIRSFFKPLNNNRRMVSSNGVSPNGKSIEMSPSVSYEIADQGMLQNKEDLTCITYNQDLPKVESSKNKWNEDLAASSHSSESRSSAEDLIGPLHFANPVSFAKGNSQDCSLNPPKAKLRKPNFSTVSKSKQGLLKNVIQLPNQATLDLYYTKRKLPLFPIKELSAQKLPQEGSVKILKQARLQPFLTQ